MRRHAAILGLSFAALGVFALFMGWAFYHVSQGGDGLRSLGPLWPYALGGALIVGGLAAFFMWLAFYSASHGYDDIDPSD